jgi:adenosine deaminase
MKSKTKAKTDGRTKRIRIFLKLFDKSGRVLDTSRMVKNKIDALITSVPAAETAYIKVCYAPELYNDGTYKIDKVQKVLNDWTSKDMIKTALEEF